MSSRSRLIFSRTSNIGSAIIRAWPPASQWSHCGCIVGNDVIEALAFKGPHRFGSVIRTPLDEFKARNSAWQIVSLWTPRTTDAEEWALSTVGLRYSWSGLFGVPLRQNYDHKQSERPSWYCGPHGAMFTRMGGNPVVKHRINHGLTPGHLWTLALAADGREEEGA